MVLREREIDIYITKLSASYRISLKAIGEITRLPKERELRNEAMEKRSSGFFFFYFSKILIIYIYIYIYILIFFALLIGRSVGV